MVWNSDSGRRAASFPCNVGGNANGVPANPLVSCIIFTRLLIRSRWVDSVIVGLLCETNGADTTDEGNILPFNEETGAAMQTWKEHRGFVRAMAAIPKKYVVSLSDTIDAGATIDIVMWDVNHPGTMTNRLDMGPRFLDTLP
jgi:hypothetical protein